MRRVLLLLLMVLMAVPAAAQMGGMTAREVAQDSGLLRKRGKTPRRVQGPTITRIETDAGRAGYLLWGHPTNTGPNFVLVALLFTSGREVTGVTIDGTPVAGAHVPGGTASSDRGSAGNVQIPVTAAQYGQGLRQGLKVEILGQPNLRFEVPVDYFRGYDARYRSVFGG